MHNPNLLSPRVEALMNERKMTRRALAEACGVNITTVSRIIRNNDWPTLFNAVMLAEYFGVSLDYLAGRTHVKEVNYGQKKVTHTR